ncbi:hypothetical protein [Pedobacter aquae]|uniref:hypothetical protein n=1 Tax=Pedobacter aquae TaxID=2605747 RepID=UPI00143D9BEB|nr:hypothetical protein [Pedobacter aquae]
MTRSPGTEYGGPQSISAIDVKLETGNRELKTDGRSPMTEYGGPQPISARDVKLETGN